MFARKILIVLMTTTALMTMTNTAHAKWNWKGPCDGWRYGETVTQQTPPGIIHRRMRRLITCVFNQYAPGQATHALYIAERESSLWPWAWNHSSNCLGLFQHMGSYWVSRVRTYLKRAWYPQADWPNVSAFNPHANAVIAARMVASSGQGWAPWGG